MSHLHGELHYHLDDGSFKFSDSEKAQNHLSDHTQNFQSFFYLLNQSVNFELKANSIIAIAEPHRSIPKPHIEMPLRPPQRFS